MKRQMFWWDCDIRKFPFYFIIIPEDEFRRPFYSFHMFRPYNLSKFKDNDRSKYRFRLYWRGHLRDGGIK